jgi:hypothetical protein
MKNNASLILYHKLECPLCEEFELELRNWIALNPLTTYKTQNIEEKESLKKKYEWRVPVLAIGETEVCSTKFNAQALESAALATFK